MFGVFAKCKKKTKLYKVVKVCSIGIKRHKRIKADANPYLPEYGKYFWERRHLKESKFLPELSARLIRQAYNRG